MWPQLFAVFLSEVSIYTALSLKSRGSLVLQNSTFVNIITYLKAHNDRIGPMAIQKWVKPDLLQNGSITVCKRIMHQIIDGGILRIFWGV